jgi:ribosomal protein S18 acetylase RimI-like enzyme
MNIEIRNLASNDVPDADRILRLAFGTPGSRIEELNRCLKLQPDGWRLALCDGRPIGMVGAVDYGPFAWIGLMAVHPDAQRQGIGGLLMSDILAWLDRRSCPLVRLDATHAGAGLYRKLGFSEIGYSLYFLEPRFEPLPDHSYEITAMQEDDLPEVIALDEAIFGARRERLLKVYWEDYPGRSYIARTKTGDLGGYLIAQKRKIGPWISMTPQAAEALLQEALALSFNGSLVQVIVPSENRTAVNLFFRLGFVEGMSHLHMVRATRYRLSGASDQSSNSPALLGKRELIYAQASYGLG